MMRRIGVYDNNPVVIIGEAGVNNIAARLKKKVITTRRRVVENLMLMSDNLP